MPKMLRGSDVVARDLEIARTPMTRLVGLGFRQDFPSGKGLLITPCNSVHTFWPRFAIDVVFLTADFRIVRICARLAHKRLSPIVWQAHQVLELPAGTAESLALEPGQSLTLSE